MSAGAEPWAAGRGGIARILIPPGALAPRDSPPNQRRWRCEQTASQNEFSPTGRSYSEDMSVIGPLAISLILYRPVRAVMYKEPPSSPHATFAGTSLGWMLPR